MRRLADLHQGGANTHARDAVISAEAARSLPHHLRDIRLDYEQNAQLAMLTCFDDDVTVQITVTSNRLRRLPTRMLCQERCYPTKCESPGILIFLALCCGAREVTNAIYRPLRH